MSEYFGDGNLQQKRDLIGAVTTVFGAGSVGLFAYSSKQHSDTNSDFASGMAMAATIGTVIGAVGLIIFLCGVKLKSSEAADARAYRHATAPRV